MKKINRIEDFMKMKLTKVEKSLSGIQEAYYIGSLDGFRIGTEIVINNPQISLENLFSKKGFYQEEYGQSAYGIGFDDSMREVIIEIKQYKEKKNEFL